VVESITVISSISIICIHLNFHKYIIVVFSMILFYEEKNRSTHIYFFFGLALSYR
jgi:hypothetical protein